jgi:shikimate kinase
VADEVERVLGERLPIYEACADCKVDVDRRTPREIVDVILVELDLPSADRVR